MQPPLFEEQVVRIRQRLADILTDEKNWREAAKVLTGIPLETGQMLEFILTF